MRAAACGIRARSRYSEFPYLCARGEFLKSSLFARKNPVDRPPHRRDHLPLKGTQKRPRAAFDGAPKRESEFEMEARMSGSQTPKSPRAIALMGPHGAGKTLLLESIAAITGAVPRKGSVSAGSSLGDFSPEARKRQMSLEVNVLTT